MSAEQWLKCFAYRSSMLGYQEGSKNNIKKKTTTNETAQIDSFEI